MTSRLVRLADQDDQVRMGLREVRTELGIPEAFPPEVQAAAEAAADEHDGVGERLDLRDIPFVTIDPAGSMDLDQAVHVRRGAAGFVVHYAIADVAAFAPAGGPIDGEARRRGLTLYAPDGRVPLHPMVLSEGAASLLAGQDRPAAVWRQSRWTTRDVSAGCVARALVQ